MDSRGKIVITTNPVVATEPPAEMRYGGVERIAFLYDAILHECGYEVIPLAPRNSRFPHPVDDRYRWPEDSLAREDRIPKAHAEDIGPALGDYARFIAEIVDGIDPDVILMLGPAAELLCTIETRNPALMRRIIVSFRNGPADNNDELLAVLNRHPEIILTALTHVHQESLRHAFRARGFAGVAERIVLAQDGVLVQGHTFAASALESRKSDIWHNIGWNLHDPNRRILSQVDYFSPNKGQLLTVEWFARAGLKELGFDCVLAGGYGWQLPTEKPSLDAHATISHRYMHRVRETIAKYKLEHHVHLLDAIPGAIVELLNRGSDFAVIPVRMDHGDLWPGTANQDKEAHGLSLGHANACGTPVLVSPHVESSRVTNMVNGLQFSDFDDAIAKARALGEACVRDEIDRSAVRQHALDHDSIETAIVRYIELMQRIIASHRPATEMPDQTSIHAALQRVADTECDRTAKLLGSAHVAEQDISINNAVVDLSDSTPHQSQSSATRRGQ